MNRADETFQVSEIISRYVLGSMTESEKEELDGWLDRSPRNKLLFEGWFVRRSLPERFWLTGVWNGRGH